MIVGGVALPVVGPEAAVAIAVRNPGLAAALGIGAPVAAVRGAFNAGATGSSNLAGVLGSAALQRTTNAVLRGSQPLSALTTVQRQLAAQFFRGVATRTGGKFAAEASAFNIERARFLEGVTNRIPGGLPDFLAR